jgi:putative transposase
VPRTYDPEFRRRVVELVRAGRPVRVVAAELGLAEATVYRWKAQDLIDRGVKPGTSTTEQDELAAAKRRIKELETELALVTQAAKQFEELVTQAAKQFEEGVRPKAKYPVIAELASQGFSAKRCCRILGVAASGFFMWRRRSPSPRQIRFAWLTELVRAIHAVSRGTYGWRRVNAELLYGHGVIVNRKTVRKIMRLNGLHGLPGPRKGFRRKANIATAADLVERRFDRPAPDQLWVTDITEHPTREGKLYCCVVLDVFSRRVVGWSIDTHQAAPLVTNALGMAIHHRNPRPEQTVIHSDHGSQFTSWAFTQRAKDSGLLPSMGTIGDAYDNAVIESFWGRMQTELLDRRRWNTRVELANAIFEYLEIFHNRQRRHSALGWRTPVEFEKLHATDVA